MKHSSIEDAAISACESVGVHYKPFPACDKFHVVDATEGKKGNGAGRLKFFSDGQGGIAFNFKTGQKQPFFINGKPGQPTPPEELERIKREQQRRAAETLKGYDRAARRALAIWQAAKPAPADHLYLIAKQIKPHGARLGSWQRTIEDENGKRQKLIIENALILPMYNADGKIRSLQAIFPEKHPLLGRNKDFLPGGQIAGLFWWIGPKTGKVLICEGFATAATLHEETGNRVYMAFTANNLMAVGRIIREKLPDAEIVFCADNDTTTAGNPGLTKATAAAQAIGASVAVPPISGDFNDYAILMKAVANDK
jgi:putative DNA primase/helicase